MNTNLTAGVATEGFFSRGRPRLGGANRPAESEKQREIRRAGGELVAQAFYTPMLKQMRDSPFKDERFSGGRGGDAFSQLLDQKIVSAMGRGNDPLVDSIVRRLGAGHTATADDQLNKALADGRLAEANIAKWGAK